MTDDTAALQAQLKVLEEQLERKRLEEEIRKLEAQLQQQEEEEEEYEEIIEYEEEEVTEEYEEEGDEIYEEIIEEEVIEDDYEDEQRQVKQKSPESVKKGRVSRWGRNAKQQQTPTQEQSQAAAPRPQASPRQKRGAPKLRGKNNPFTKALEEKKAALAQLEQEKATRAAAAAAKATATTAASGGGDDGDDGGPLPPLPPFTPRVIPRDVPASPAGQETPMELLIGTKLYSQGKLISRSTVAGCAGMDLIILFFGAGWRRECKLFVPLLLDFYTITTATSIAGNDDVKLECVYVPQDRNLDEFKKFFSKTPFLSMATGTAELKNVMARSLQITDVPTVIVLEASTGHVISTQGVSEIQSMKRRNVEQYQALVRKWKASTPVPVADAEKAGIVQRDGNLQRGLLYWQE